MNDPQIREILSGYFAGNKSPLKIHELGVIGGSVRADYTILNCDAFCGFEIKSAVDSLVRLPRQVDAYNDTFDMCSLVLDGDGDHLDKALLIIPEWWGVLIAHKNGLLTAHRAAKPNPSVSVYGRLWLLWKDEIQDILRSKGFSKGVSSANKSKLRDMLNSCIIDIGEARRIVINAMLKRSGWRNSLEKRPE